MSLPPDSPYQSGDLELEVRVDKATTKKAGASDAESRAVNAAAKALQPQLLRALQTLDAEMQARCAAKE